MQHRDLSGPFEVDFERPPLSDAGLFAITGPTGAGKSTILDVLCLALFGDTPRTKGGGNLPVPVTGDGADTETITAKDARNLLRRGAVDGRAEADFLGIDGRRYRARWEVRRARSRPDGALQPEKRSLWKIDDGNEEGIASGTRDVNQAVAKALGLSFEQFRKAVLLAQGEFAAFLKADDTARAELLERITGADVYTRLSKRAYEKWSDFSRTLTGLDAAIDGLVPLPEGERQRLEAEQELLRTEIQGVEARLRSLAEAKRRSDGASEVARELGEARIRLEGRAGDLSRETRSRDDEAARLAAAQTESDAARRAREERQPEIDRALVFDDRIGAKEAEASRLEEERKRSEAALDEAVRADAALADQLSRARETESEAAAWIEAHAEAASLVAQWERCRRDLRQLADTAHTVNGVRLELEGAIRREASAAGLAMEASERRDAAARGLVEAERKVAGAEEAAAAFDRTALALEEKALSGEIEVLGTLEALAAQLASAASRIERARETAERDQAAAAALDGEAERKAGRAREDEEALERLEAERNEAAATRDLAGLRPELREGHACPLCGSPSHPWAEAGSVPADRTAELDSAVASARRRLADARSEETRLRAEANASRQRSAEQASAAERAAEERDDARRRWREAGSGLPAADALREPPTDSAGLCEARVTGSERLVRCRARRDGVRSEQSRALQAEAESARARNARDAAAQEHARAVSTSEEAAGALASAREEQTGRNARLGELERTRQALAAELAGLAGDDGTARALLESDPGAVEAQWGRVVEEYLGHETRRKASAMEATELGLRQAGSRSNLESASRAAEEARGRAKRSAEELRRVREERGSVLEGRPVDAVLHELDGAAARCAEALAAAAEAYQLSEARRAGAESAVQAAREELERTASKAAAANAARDESLVALGIDAGPAALAALEEAVASAKLSLDEKNATCQDRLARLLLDDRTRDQRREAEQRRRDAGERGSVWQQLSGLIGSASGNEFRKFAQGITLKTLVASANHHLGDLARRYRLVPAPGTELGLLVVDGDMGDERRSVESLSGGESFLVSLALALGLTSLSTRSTAIRSLFIDEGFGSLDLDTLRRAMSALDALQAKGRRIGVISHVQGMADEIGVQVKVVPRGGGRSEVKVVGG